MDFIIYCGIPPLLMNLFHFDSYAIGMFVWAVLYFIWCLTKRRRLILTKPAIVLILLSAISIPVTFAFGHFLKLPKQLFSLFLVIILFISSTAFFNVLVKKINRDRGRTIKISLLILTVFGILALLGLSRIGAYKKSSSVFPFSEPSHFALVFGPLGCAAIMYSRKIWAWGIVLCTLFFGAFFPNMTITFYALLYLFILAGPLIVGVLASGVIASFLFLGLQSSSRLDYFVSRVSSQDGKSNASRLVYLQGWQSMVTASEYSSGLGVGFQNLGVEPVSEAGNILTALNLEGLNRSDGGFLAAKVIGEFGIIGLLLVIYALKISFESLFELRSLYLNSTEDSADRGGGQIFCLCYLAVFSVELLVRGYGYMSPGLFAFVYAIQNRRLKALC